MELSIIQSSVNGLVPTEQKKNSSFIEANTVEISLNEIRDEHIIPVFAKDNEPLISHFEFIEAAQEAATRNFDLLGLPELQIRVSHPVKGRVPKARNKPANELLDHEKTLYYERMAFVIEIPGITEIVNGSKLNLTIGGVKSYHEDKIGKHKGSGEHFRMFVGFRNLICTNLCISTDGYSGKVVVSTMNSLYEEFFTLLKRYNPISHAKQLGELFEYELPEQSFAQLMGRLRMAQYKPGNGSGLKYDFILSDTQVNQVIKGYYRDPHFSMDTDGSISLWKLYNLLTGANKSSYIDSFLERGVNAFTFTSKIARVLEGDESSWFLQ